MSTYAGATERAAPPSRRRRAPRHASIILQQRPPAQRRLYAIDGMRLLAALFVAAHHYAGTWRVNQPGNLIWGRPVSDIMPTVFRF